LCNLLAIAATAIVAFAAPGCSAESIQRKPQDLAGEHVSFTTSDGILLRGHLYGSGATGIILAHMFPADQSDWTDFAQVLAAHGYTALTFDFRGFTESEGRTDTKFADRDLLAAYQFLRPRVSRIFIAGASFGAEAAILVAAREPVAGVICISTPISFGGLSVKEAVRQVRAPILFVTSEDDPLVAGQPEILYRLAEAPKSFQSFSGRAHGTAILFGPHGPELRNLMLQFIAANDHRAASVSSKIE
jgi:pimeloyl-ACP methyl ester carboxylesterase